MAKRKLNVLETELYEIQSMKSNYANQRNKKHSLDSDEEDSTDEDYLTDDDIEGEEDTTILEESNITRMTAFNMQEEQEEGHFDKNGYFICNNCNDIHDDWLDNIDWQQIKTMSSKCELTKVQNGLTNDDDFELEEGRNVVTVYKDLIAYLKPEETVGKAIQRLGRINEGLSSIERLRRRKAGVTNVNEDVSKVTELADRILTHFGNMNIYQETYEFIAHKIRTCETDKEPGLDMYADDFVEKENSKTADYRENEENGEEDDVTWEFKWNKGNEKIEGPYTSLQMLRWAKEGYFKTGVWVRKAGETGQFYTSSRIDFELYCN